MKQHVHHIDCDPTNDREYNLIAVDQLTHKRLHEQLYLLFDSWNLGNRKSKHYYFYLQHFLNTGDLVFDRDVPEYRFYPIPGGALDQYRIKVESTGLILPLRIDHQQQVDNLKTRLKALNELTAAVFAGYVE